ncbi:MAG: VOC family protein [Gemmatimonadota bacterium]
MSANGFSWFELVTSDLDAAAAFYGRVLGWTAADFPGSPERYLIVRAQDEDVGGVMALPAGMSQPFWLTYVGVPDRDAAVASLAGQRATIVRSFEVPNVGAIALVEDPQGAGFAVIQGYREGESKSFSTTKVGHLNWNELHTTDWEVAWDFYSGVFGWKKDTAMDMGAMGTYQIFSINGDRAGAMMNNSNVPMPIWVPYFGVESASTAEQLVREHGGKVTQTPHEVPGDRFILEATDPQGARFALVGGR